MRFAALRLVMQHRRARSVAALLARLALGALATASLSAPAEDLLRPPEEDFGLPTADEIRALPSGVDGVSLALDLHTTGDTTHVVATVRNDGPHAAFVAWPEPCTAGKRVFADGDVLIVQRSLSLPPKVWRHLHDREAVRGFGVVVPAGDTLTERIALRSPVAECTVDTRLGTLGRRLGEVAPSSRLLVVYDVVALPDESFVGHGLGREMRGIPERRSVLARPRWRMLTAETTLPTPVPVVRSRPAHDVERSWEAPRVEVCDASPSVEPSLVRRTGSRRWDEPPPAALALRPPDTTGTRWKLPHRRLGRDWLPDFVDENAHWWRNRAYRGQLREPVQMIAECPGASCRDDLGDVIGFRDDDGAGHSVEIAHGSAWLAARYVETTPGWAETRAEEKLRAALRVLPGAGFGCAPVTVEWAETPEGLRASTAFDTPWASVRRYDERVDFWVDREAVSMIMAKRYRLAGVGGWAHVAPADWLEALAELRPEEE